MSASKKGFWGFFFFFFLLGVERSIPTPGIGGASAGCRGKWTGCRGTHSVLSHRRRGLVYYFQLAAPYENQPHRFERLHLARMGGITRPYKVRQLASKTGQGNGASSHRGPLFRSSLP